MLTCKITCPTHTYHPVIISKNPGFRALPNSVFFSFNKYKNMFFLLFLAAGFCPKNLAWWFCPSLGGLQPPPPPHWLVRLWLSVFFLFRWLHPAAVGDNNNILIWSSFSSNGVSNWRTTQPPRYSVAATDCLHPVGPCPRSSRSWRSDRTPERYERLSGMPVPHWWHAWRSSRNTASRRGTRTTPELASLEPVITSFWTWT